MTDAEEKVFEKIESALQEHADALSDEFAEAHLVLLAVQDGQLHLCHNILTGDAAVVEALRDIADQLAKEIERGERVHVYKPRDPAS